MKVGMICRMDNSGLSTLSWEFARHIKPAKVLLVENHVNQVFPERYKDFDTRLAGNKLSKETIDWFLSDIDIIFTCETFYDWSIVKMARKRGVKTILYTMFEMSPEGSFPLMPDMLLCPSTLDYETFKGYSTRVEYLPVPIATDRLHWNERKIAKTFIHSASHGGMNGRKGTQLFLDAIPLVKNKDVRFIIYSWYSNFKVPNDPRVELRVVNFKNYWQVWREGDVLVYPQDYNGICLPVIEAFSSGMGVVTTKIHPFDKYLPNELMFEPSGFYETRVSRGMIKVQAAIIPKESIANKIDEFAMKDISSFSKQGERYAKDNSWEALLPRYLSLFKSLCGQ